MSIELLIRSAGVLQLLQTPAIIAGQRGLGWTRELQRLTPLGRNFVHSIAAGIYIYVTGGGIMTVTYARDIAQTKLGLALCALQALAWLVRAGFQWLCMHRSWGAQARWLHYAMLANYSTLAAVYSFATVVRLFE